MPEHRTGAAAVLDDKGRLVGIMTERDIVQRAVGVFRNVDETIVDKIMTRHPTSKGFRHLPVMDGKKVIGILDIRDLYDAMADTLNNTIQKNEAMLSYAYGTPYSASCSGYM
jgi:CBS domain-containing protein